MRRIREYKWAIAAASVLILTLTVIGVQYSADQATDSYRITSISCDNIRAGMSGAQVNDILGRTADQQYHPWDISVLLAPAPGTIPEWEKIWIGKDKAAIIVHFDTDGKVCNKQFFVKLGEDD